MDDLFDGDCMVINGYIGEWLLMVVNGDLMVIYVMVIVWWLPSGKLTIRYWKWPFIVDLPIKNGDFL